MTDEEKAVEHDARLEAEAHPRVGCWYALVVDGFRPPGVIFGYVTALTPRWVTVVGWGRAFITDKELNERSLPRAPPGVDVINLDHVITFTLMRTPRFVSQFYESFDRLIKKGEPW